VRHGSPGNDIGKYLLATEEVHGVVEAGQVMISTGTISIPFPRPPKSLLMSSKWAGHDLGGDHPMPMTSDGRSSKWAGHGDHDLGEAPRLARWRQVRLGTRGNDTWKYIRATEARVIGA